MADHGSSTSSGSTSDDQPVSNWPIPLQLDSTGPLPPLPLERPRARWTVRPIHRGRPVMDGLPFMCACPDCGAPMTVRPWLLVAHCWRCQAIVQISEEWVEDFSPERASVSMPAPPPLAPQDAPAVPPPAPPTPPPPPPVDTVTEGWGYATIHRMFRDTPAWVVSLLLHMIALTILGLLSHAKPDDLFITLSTFLSANDSEGGRIENPFPEAELVYDMPVPEELDLSDPRDRQEFVKAQEDAAELQEDPNAPDILRADLTTVREQVGTVSDIRYALTARDPRVRAQVVTKEGGTTMTEAAVARGLRWIAKAQRSDGSWRLRGYDSDGSSAESPTAATGMALLAFLGAGQTHLHGKYRDEVSQALVWMLKVQGKNGDLRGPVKNDESMYGHGQAAIALCEAYLMTGDEELREPAQRAIDFCVKAQYDDGGWRYDPHNPRRPEEGDTSVTGWFLMALQSARAARLDVPPESMELAGQFLDRVQSQNGASYAYVASRRRYPSSTMTAEGLLCRVYLGWGRDEYGLRKGVNDLLKDYPPRASTPNIYYWYYATQVMHHYGGKPWETWNKKMRTILVDTQTRRGRHAGSWAPNGPYSETGGRLYMTALAVCTLEVYYRHLPLFRPIDL